MQTSSHVDTNLPVRNLDFLRASAVSFVFLSHLVIGLTSDLEWLQIMGRMGVLLFFVHTSYVLMHSLERLSKIYSQTKFITTFYIRRALRIYPLSMVTVTVLTLAGFPYADVATQSLKVFFSNFFLVENLAGLPHATAVLWTLPIELQTYLFLPFFFLIARKSIAGVVGLMIFATLLGFWAIPIGGERLDVLLFAPCFIAGVLSYSISVHKNYFPKIKGRYWALILIGVALLLGAILRPEAGRSVIYGWLATILIALLIPLFEDMVESWLSCIAHQIAKYSYGIYLLHMAAIRMSNNWFEAIIVTALFSILAYHLIEAPFIRLGQKLTRTNGVENRTLLTSIPPP